MINHAPSDYSCPFCSLIATGKDEYGEREDEIVYKDEHIMAFIGAAKWPSNNGVVLVIPIIHYETLYELPDEIGAQIFSLSKKIAIAMKKAYKTDGISTRQHNEPAGNQSVFHYHFQVVPRFKNDELYANHRKKVDNTAKERKSFARKLKKYL